MSAVPSDRGGALYTHPTPLDDAVIVDKLRVHAVDRVDAAGAMAASHIATALRNKLARSKEARIVFAAAPSQDAVLRALAREPGIDWPRVTAFQMDEYVGLPDDHPQLFGRYLDQHIYSVVRPGRVHKMRPGDRDDDEADRYARLLAEAPIHVVCLGIGENGHIAFNDPGLADFDDSLTVKVVTLDDVSRRQQVNDGCFLSVDEVPKYAVTLTVPALVSAGTLVACVSGERKRDAVRRTLFEPVGTDCPASVIRRHDDARLFLDSAATPSDLLALKQAGP